MKRRKQPLAVLGIDRIHELWASEVRNDEIMQALGISRWTLERMKIDLKLPNRPTRKSWHKPHLTPKSAKEIEPEVTPDEVRHRVAQCQARWTDEMFVLRSMGRVRPVPYVMPVVSLGRMQ